ncbi:unnamed protein product [Boreogadus saida]
MSWIEHSGSGGSSSEGAFLISTVKRPVQEQERRRATEVDPTVNLTGSVPLSSPPSDRWTGVDVIGCVSELIAIGTLISEEREMCQPIRGELS